MSNILFKSDIADTLDYNRADMALSARQGRALKQMLSSIKKEMMLEAHPVGSLYWSMEATDPSKLFGGTWEQIKDRFIWATTSNPGGSGGSYTQTLSTANLPSHNHSYTRVTGIQGTSISTNQMPSHTHSIGRSNQGGGRTDWGLTGGGAHGGNVALNSGNGSMSVGSTGGNGSHSHGVNTGNYSTDSTGSGSAFSIMPPYLEAYCWKRTA